MGKITLTPKEASLLGDLRSQEQICVEKYKKYSSQACDAGLKNLFSYLSQNEQQHLDTLNTIGAGNVPQMSSSQSNAKPSVPQTYGTGEDSCKLNDSYLCSDALATEKHASSLYDTCIFEFTDKNVRNSLNHIQKEEQEHGENIYDYMSQNNMYC